MADTRFNFNNLRELGESPALRQFVLLIGVAIAVAVGLWGFRWSQEPAFVPLYSGLADRDAADVADALRSSGIAFKFDNGMGGISVPQSQLDQARLQLAGKGLPRAQGVGFEMMEKDQGFGTSQFIENARYQYALETELARTVMSLQPVRAARVHLAIPKPSAFARSSDVPSASVFVDLHSGRLLEQNQVASIVHMVASSVAGMSPDAVTVIDQNGRLLSQNGTGSDAVRNAEHMEQTRRMEADYVRRINDLLRPMLGEGRVSAQVAADVDYAVIEEAREVYAPDSGQLRSEQLAEDTRRSNERSGIPGATSNQPPEATANPPLNTVAGAQNDGAVRDVSRQSVRNYELDRTISHKRQSSGQIRRLSVAVLVDNVPRQKTDGSGQVEYLPLTDAELTKVESLVREAVGFDPQRGDSVSVQNAPFIRDVIDPPEPLPIWKRGEVRDWVRQGGGALLLLVLLLFIVRPMLRSLMAAPFKPQPELEDGFAEPAAITDANAGAAAGLDQAALAAMADNRLALSGAAPVAGALPNREYEDKLQIARQAVSQDPKRVAQVIKNWVGE